MIENFNKKIDVKIHENSLSNEETEEIIKLIKTENVNAILSKFSTNLIREYFYEKKLDFKLIGKKIRLFSIFFVFLKQHM